jgi:hypothetical protein
MNRTPILMFASCAVALGVAAFVHGPAAAQDATVGRTAAATLAPSPQEEVQGEVAEDPLTVAWNRFAAADGETKAQLLAQAKAKIEALADPEVRKLLELRDRARREIKVAPPREPVFYTCEEYAPVQATRHFEPDDSSYALEQEGLMQVWIDPAPYLERVRYDFATTDVVSLGFQATVDEEYWDLLAGNVPDTDLLAAWLMRKWDFDAKLDKLADYFGHVYCDRLGAAFKHITIYDAFRSGATVEMPDADVIAFARHILNDRSFVSPIPPDGKQAKLYESIKQSFTKLRDHRTLIESAARVFLNDEGALREELEGLRLRLMYLFEENGSDPSRIATALAATKTRDGFVEAMDKITETKRERWDAHLIEWRKRRQTTRWAVALAAQEVLKEVGYLESK